MKTLLVIKELVSRYGLFEIILKILALGLLIFSSHVLIQAFQPGTNMYIVFRTEQPSPFLVVGGFVMFSVFLLIKKF